MNEKRKKRQKGKLKKQFKNRGDLIPFLFPAMFFAIVFAYIPMLGLVMAFKENPNLLGSSSAIQGILDADWVMFDHFKKIFSQPQFISALSNTLIISALKILVVFPLPIMLAILINELRGKVMKKTLQIAMYLPYFLSWATIAGIFIAILNKNTGVVNNFIEFSGHERIDFITNNDNFRQLLVSTTAWKDIGWSAITYIAAITVLDPSLTEVAKIDGASKMQQIWYVTLPSIMPTIAVMFILRIGYVMDAGFEQVFMFYSPFIQESGDILGTYTYRLVRQSSLIPQYSLSTAIGLFNSVVSLTLVICGNYISKKLFKRGVW
ncbi:MAG: ABC transporter permease [Turicibacter sp.]